MKLIFRVTSLCLFFFQSVVLGQSTCDANPVGPFVIPVRNVTLTSGGITRGIAFSVGSPGQSIAAFADDGSNNTLLLDTGDFCPATDTLRSCEIKPGGYFDLGASSTWINASSAAAAGAAPVDSFDPTDLFGSDVLQANASTQFKSFPLGIQRGTAPGSGGNNLGLGRNSTLLNALKSAKVIASNSWGLFWGLTGVDSSSQVDGALILGGYDTAKATGPNLTQSIGTGDCSFSVVVTAITMNFPNGTAYNILGTSHGAALRFCLHPANRIMTIPFDLWQNFAAHAGGTYIGRSVGEEIWGEVYKADGVYPGDLTLTLASGLDIKIPNNQVVTPDYTVDSSGQVTSNATTRLVTVSSLQEVNSNDIPLLGRNFLEAAYLYVNYDRNEFTLWQATPTTEQKLVAVGPGPFCSSTSTTTAAGNTPSAGLSPSASGDSSSSPAPSSNPNTSSSPLSTPSVPTGAIIGGALGAAAILGLLIGAALFFRRRRSRHADARGTYPEKAELPDYKRQFELHAAASPRELPAVEHAVEVGPGMRHEMDGYGVKQGR